MRRSGCSTGSRPLNRRRQSPRPARSWGFLIPLILYNPSTRRLAFHDNLVLASRYVILGGHGERNRILTRLQTHIHRLRLPLCVMVITGSHGTHIDSRSGQHNEISCSQKSSASAYAHHPFSLILLGRQMATPI
jgi:hypothetical protein